MKLLFALKKKVFRDAVRFILILGFQSDQFAKLVTELKFSGECWLFLVHCTLLVYEYRRKPFHFWLSKDIVPCHFKIMNSITNMFNVYVA